MKTTNLLLALGLIAALLLGGCNSPARVGALRNESKSVELGNTRSVSAQINFGAGALHVTGGAEKLLEADFTYNVAQIKPEVKYTNGTLVVQQPDTWSLPDLRGIEDFRNEWDLRLNDEVPMDLSLDIGAGSGNLQLAGLSLTGLDIRLGFGEYTIDLSGDWARNLDVTISPGAANISLRLPKQVGVRVKVEEGPHTIDTTGLAQDGNVYTNDAYDVAGVTMRVNIDSGPGQISLIVDGEEAAVWPEE